MQVDCISCEAEWDEEFDGTPPYRAQCLDCGARFFATPCGPNRYSQRVWWGTVICRTLATAVIGIGFVGLANQGHPAWMIAAILFALFLAHGARDWVEAASYVSSKSDGGESR